MDLEDRRRAAMKAREFKKSVPKAEPAMKAHELKKTVPKAEPNGQPKEMSDENIKWTVLVREIQLRMNEQADAEWDPKWFFESTGQRSSEYITFVRYTLALTGLKGPIELTKDEWFTLSDRMLLVGRGMKRTPFKPSQTFVPVGRLRYKWLLVRWITAAEQWHKDGHINRVHAVFQWISTLHGQFSLGPSVVSCSAKLCRRMLRLAESIHDRAHRKSAITTVAEDYLHASRFGNQFAGTVAIMDFFMNGIFSEFIEDYVARVGQRSIPAELQLLKLEGEMHADFLFAQGEFEWKNHGFGMHAKMLPDSFATWCVLQTQVIGEKVTRYVQKGHWIPHSQATCVREIISAALKLSEPHIRKQVLQILNMFMHAVHSTRCSSFVNAFGKSTGKLNYEKGHANHVPARKHHEVPSPLGIVDAERTDSYDTDVFESEDARSGLYTSMEVKTVEAVKAPVPFGASLDCVVLDATKTRIALTLPQSSLSLSSSSSSSNSVLSLDMDVDTDSKQSSSSSSSSSSVSLVPQKRKRTRDVAGLDETKEDEKSSLDAFSPWPVREEKSSRPPLTKRAKKQHKPLKRPWPQRHYNDEYMSDITIECQGTQFYAHKFVLAGLSDMFSRMCSPDGPAMMESKTNVIDLSAFPVPTVRAFLMHSYQFPLGGLLRELDASLALHGFARTYGMSGLRKFAMSELIHGLRRQMAFPHPTVVTEIGKIASVQCSARERTWIAQALIHAFCQRRLMSGFDDSVYEVFVAMQTSAADFFAVFVEELLNFILLW